MFSDQEQAFLQVQPLARIATVATDRQPTVDAVGFEFDGARSTLEVTAFRLHASIRM